MPSNIFRDCSRKYASLIKGELLSGHSFEIPAVVSGGDYWFSLLVIFRLLGARWHGSFPASRSMRSWLWLSTHQISSKLSKYHLGSSANEFYRSKQYLLHYLGPKLGYYDGWGPCNEMQCTCVSLAALSRNSLADSRSFKFFNSISKAWFNHFPDGLVHRGFQMISVQANVWAESNLSKALKPIQEEMAWNRCHGCRYC